MVALLPAGAASAAAEQLLLVSLNVLLPNSIDGWWLYKYYPPGVPDAAMAWRHAQRCSSRYCCAPIRHRLPPGGARPRASSPILPSSTPGYNAALYGKGRMRPATLWKRRALRSATPPARSRPPTRSLRPAGAQDGAPLDVHDAARHDAGRDARRPHAPHRAALAGRRRRARRAAPPLWIVNVHLSAGAEARRRLSQVHDGLDRIRKQRASATRPPPRAAVVVAGDFNSQGATAVRELLTRGEVLPDYREAGDPTEREQASTEVTSKPKRQVVGAFVDACDGGALCGPTYYAPTLQPLMVDDATGAITDGLRAALADCFAKLSADGKVLTMEEQRKWLVAVNKRRGRQRQAAARRARRSERRARPRRVCRRVRGGEGRANFGASSTMPCSAATGWRSPCGAVHRRL